MFLDNFLRCGYTFTHDEYELETRYVMTMASLAIIGFFLIIVSLLYYILGNYDNTIVFGLATFLVFISIYLARRVGKDNYTKLVYVMTVFFLLLIVYSYRLNYDIYPISAWILIQVLVSFLVLDIKLAILITIIFSIAIILMNYILGYNSLEFILLKISPVIIGLVLITMIEKNSLKLYSY